MRNCENDFKERLLETLSDPDVCELIKKIIGIQEPQNNNREETSKQITVSIDSNIEQISDPNTILELEKSRNQFEELTSSLVETEKKLKAADERCKKLERENQRLRKEHGAIVERCEGAEKEIEKLSSEIRETEMIRKTQQTQLANYEKDLNRAKRDMEMFSEFEGIVALYRDYKDLPANVFSAASSIIHADSASVFFVSACQKDNMLALWDYLKTEWDGLDDKCKDSILRILDLSMKLINSQFQMPIFQFADCNVGDVFDEELHIRATGSSRYSGKIVKVCLPGIWNNYKNVATKKSLVVV